MANPVPNRANSPKRMIKRAANFVMDVATLGGTNMGYQSTRHQQKLVRKQNSDAQKMWEGKVPFPESKPKSEW